MVLAGREQDLDGATDSVVLGLVPEQELEPGAAARRAKGTAHQESGAHGASLAPSGAAGGSALRGRARGRAVAIARHGQRDVPRFEVRHRVFPEAAAAHGFVAPARKRHRTTTVLTAPRDRPLSRLALHPATRLRSPRG